MTNENIDFVSLRAWIVFFHFCFFLQGKVFTFWCDNLCSIKQAFFLKFNKCLFTYCYNNEFIFEKNCVSNLNLYGSTVKTVMSTIIHSPFRRRWIQILPNEMPSKLSKLRVSCWTCIWMGQRGYWRCVDQVWTFNCR